ncbi:thiol reductant ABC exporter subunit CydD [Nocardioides dongkuii]|uniref:thiol reductant ABC exporter subunit CydD n=1 Tax=Nocardioides dongkuii TaxID=2760089 RepID=UPI0015FDD820|nr:thiol reductant ABC exporter subunit CydD [Nocardioides dongkuii]
MKPLDPRVLPHLRPARVSLAVVVVGNLLAGVLLVAQAFALATLVTRLVTGGWRADLSADGWAGPALALLAVTVGRGLLSAVVDAAASRAAGQVATHLRRTVLQRALDLDAVSLAEHRTGELGLLATRGVAAVEPYLTRYLPTLVLAGVLPALTVLAIATQDWLSALVVVLTLPLVPVFAVLIGMSTRDRADREWRILSQLSGHFVDVVRGLPTLVAHRRARAQAPRIRAITDRYRRANGDVLKLAFASSAALELIATISVALVAVLVGLRLAADGMELQTALTVLLLAPEAYWPLRRVGAEFHAAAEGSATFEAIHDLTAQPLPAAGTEPAPLAPAPLRIDHLSIRWPGRDRPALEGLDVGIPARGLTVVTGPSGCGKSTLLAALMREVPITGGLVRVGGVDLTSLDPDSWRSRVAHVAQRPWLTDGTLADNVRLGRPDADDAAVIGALSRVDLTEVVDALPLGIHTPLGEDGAGLSAGQRARLALARVIVSERPFVLLDEPTAHLDPATEEVLLRTLRDLARDRCVLAVAHSQALVDAADTVVALTAAGMAAGMAAEPVAPRVAPGDAGAPPRAREATPGTPEAPGPSAGSPDPAPSHPRARLALATLLGVLASTSGIALTATAGWLIVRAAEHPPVLMLMVAIVGVRTFGLARPALRYAERLTSHDVALRELAERRASVYDALVPLVPGRLGRHRGDLLASVVDDVDALLDDQLRVRMPLVTWVGAGAVTTLVATWFLPAAGLVTAALVLLTGMLSWATARYGTARHAAEQVAARAELSRRSLSLLTDARNLVQWQAGARAVDHVQQAGAALARAADRTTLWLVLARAWPMLAAGIGMVTMAAVGGSALREGTVSGPVVALLVLLPLALVDVLGPVADAGALQVSTRAAARRLDELTALPPAVADPADPLPLPCPLSPADAAVRLAEVTAAWADRDVLDPISLDLPPGRRIGLVGPSGSGKSTLAAVLVRFLDPTAGSYRLAGLDVRSLAADDVRGVVGLLDDDPYLFGSTLVENVRLAAPAAGDDQVEAALRAARLGDWLDALPQGLQTRLGDGGAAVSGGERARIGLARMLLADHRVLVLDEPTAHLDTRTARAVADELLAVTSDRTVVWITHGTVGLDRMDEIVRLGQEEPARVP